MAAAASTSASNGDNKAAALLTASTPAPTSTSTLSYLPAVPPKTYKEWVCHKIGDALVPRDVPLNPPADDEVQIKMIASGVCASDVDILRGKFGDAWPFPKTGVVAGHEGVGVVSAVGKGVKSHVVGDAVGVGVTVDSCGACRTCSVLRQENMCDRKTGTVSTVGTFGEYMTVKARFAIKVPAANAVTGESGFSVSDLALTGPLFCAGATVFAPFMNHTIQPGSRVAVLGVGGLGHLALKIANKWGCNVTALSTNASKKDAIMKMGAHRFVDIKADPELKSCANTFDFVLDCGNGVDTNYNALVNSLRQNGRVILLGVLLGNISVSPMSLIFGQKGVVGSLVGGIGHYNAMIAFCAQHSILPQTQLYAFDDINKAIADVRAGTVRYRAVLVHPK